MACVVNVKFFFYGLILLQFDNIIKQCKTPLKKLGKAQLLSRNPVFCLKIWKIWQAPTTLEFNFSSWSFAHVYIFINNSRSKQNEKNPEQAFVGIIKWEISAKNIKVRGSWSPSKFSIFYDRLPGFSEIIGLSLNLGFGFCITWLVLSNYKKIGP